jgi:hypothetical protein
VNYPEGAIFQKYFFGQNKGYMLWIVDGRLTLTLGDNTAFACSDNFYYLPKGWHPVAGAKNGTAPLRLYINGREVTSYIQQDNGYAFELPTGILARIGARGDAYNENPSIYDWEGGIDDVRVYSRALPVEEIGRLYQLGATTKVNTTLPTQPTLATGLVGHWTMDGPDIGPNIRDKSGQGNHGNLVHGGSGTTTAPGAIGQAMRFDGTNDVVTVPGASSISITGDYSTSIWIKADASQQTWAGIYAKTQNGTDGQYSLQLDDSNNLVVYHHNSWNVDTLIDLSDLTGGWHHVGIVRSGTNFKAYLDGVLKQDTTYEYVPGSGTGALYIGSERARIAFWTGDLDDLRIYNRALTADEIQRLYRLGATTKVNTTINTQPSLATGLVGHWTFDGPDIGPNIRDRSGQGNHGNLVHGGSGTTTAPGAIGQAMEFDGVGDYVDAGLMSVLDGKTNASLCFWAKRRTSTSVMNVQRGRGQDYATRFGIEWWSDSTIYVTVENELKSWPNVANATFGVWTHLCLAYDGSKSGLNRTKLYVNGVLQTLTPGGSGGQNDPAASIATVTDQTYGFGIGRGHGGGWGEFTSTDGAIDDVRIYTRTLSADEITQLYKLGAN